MSTEQKSRTLLGRFIACTAEAMVDRGWEVDANDPPDADSIFLGTFRQSIGAEWLATVEFILESGPIIYGVEFHLSGPRKVNTFSATVGGELGVRHLPTERLLRALDVRAEVDISLELADIFEEAGNELPAMTDAQSVDRASRVLVAVVDAHAMPFARQHADVDAVIAFIADGRQISRTPQAGYMLVPALLAASGRHDEARAALAEFHQAPKSDPDDDERYAQFADQLSKWLDKPTPA
jgi:hypothetical protein